MGHFFEDEEEEVVAEPLNKNDLSFCLELTRAQKDARTEKQERVTLITTFSFVVQNVSLLLSRFHGSPCTCPGMIRSLTGHLRHPHFPAPAPQIDFALTSQNDSRTHSAEGPVI